MVSPSPQPLAPVPFYFGEAAHPLFGWLHPVDCAPAPLGVLICAPLGHEDLATHRSLRRLAMALAAAGLPVLRFDHAGWGDSADSDPSRPWLLAVRDSLQSAADALKARTGATRLALVGVRLSALLAAEAAARRSDVDALVALLPVASGRTWLRECRLIHRDPEGSGSAPALLPVLDLGGLVLDAATAAEVGALRWPQAAQLLPRALLIERDDLPATGSADLLGAMARQVDQLRLPELDRMTAVAHSAHAPPAMFDQVVDWLLQRRDEAAALLGSPALPPHGGEPADDFGDAAALRAEISLHLPVFGASTATCGDLTERVIRLGTGLIGVLTLPPRALGAERPPTGLLLLPSGAERRIGPHRLWVPFARQRAAAGDVVLRLDLASLGDSDARPGGRDHDVYDPLGPADIAAAVAWLRAEQGVVKCNAVGLCSGAYQVWRAALGGLAFARLVEVNPVVFHWKPGMSLDPTTLAFGQLGISSQAFKSLRDPQRWAKLLRGQVNLPVILSAVAGRAKGKLKSWGRGMARTARMPLTDDLASELRTVTNQGTRLDFVFSESDPGRQLLMQEAGRTLDVLRRRQRIRLRIVEGADHTFSRQPAREALYRQLHALLDDSSAP